jgi:hypothetical protein
VTVRELREELARYEENAEVSLKFDADSHPSMMIVVGNTSRVLVIQGSKTPEPGQPE